MDFSVRPATLDDVPALENLIADSVMTLQARDYTLAQRQGALGTVFGVDRQLIKDQTYYVIAIDSGIVACGGWSYRKALFGGDAIADKNDGALDPSVDAARIRAFFVAPAWSRRGLGTKILATCESAAQAAGFTRFELVATLTGEPLYRAHGFQAIERCTTPLPNGAQLPVIRMVKHRGTHG